MFVTVLTALSVLFPTTAQVVALGLAMSTFGGSLFTLGAAFVILSTLHDQVSCATRVGMVSMRTGIGVMLVGFALIVPTTPVPFGASVQPLDTVTRNAGLADDVCASAATGSPGMFRSASRPQ